ncbi:hypothetical protein AgCh_004678 [Apium graveolens]
MVIKKNRRAVLMQEYEQFNVKADESITDIYDRFLTLLNDLSLQRKNKKGQKMNVVALNAETHKGKEKISKRLRRRNIVEESDTNKSSNPDTDTDEDSELDLDDSQVVEMAAMGHLANECPKSTGKVLVTTNSNKDWMDSSELTMMMNAMHSWQLMERMLQELIRLEKVLKKEREVFKIWMTSGRKVHSFISDKNWKECLGYNKFTYRNINKAFNNTTPIKFVRTNENGVKFVYQVGSTSKNPDKKKDEPRVSDKKKEEPKIQQKKSKNIGLLSKIQLDKKICEVTSRSHKSRSKRGRNGKQGINKASNYKCIYNAPRKAYFNYGITNHIAIDCGKPKNKVTKIPESDNSGRSVFYKPQNPCSHCGSSWHSIYTCKDYHSLYHNNYDPLPKFNKIAILNRIAKLNVHTSYKLKIVKTNPDGAIPGGSIPEKNSPTAKIHRTGTKSMLSEYEEKVGPMVSYGNRNVGKILGYGNIIIGNIIISNIALVDGLKHNLLSISQITNIGLYVVFNDTHCEVVHKITNEIIFKGYRYGNIYEAKLYANNDGPETCLRLFTYDERDVTLYALGIGACGTNALDDKDLKYVYHENGQKFIKIRNKTSVVGLHDKGKAAILELEVLSYGESFDEPIYMNREMEVALNTDWCEYRAGCDGLVTLSLGGKLLENKESDGFDMPNLVEQDQGKDSRGDRGGCQKLEMFEEGIKARGTQKFIEWPSIASGVQPRI